MSLLEVASLNAGYDQHDVLHDVSLTVAQNEVVCVLGANGAGKSTLLKAIVGLLKPRAGSIQFNNENITGRRPDEILGLTLCPEGRRLFPEMTILENIKMGAYRIPGRRLFAERLERLYAIFPKLAERSSQMASSLSGGEQQMVAIARALVSNPHLLLLDEPTLGLAPKVISEVGHLITTLRQQGIAVLLVEQNAKLALKLSNRGYVMQMGRILLTGPSQQLIDDPTVRQIYLGG